jgi:hypothetical protein
VARQDVLYERRTGVSHLSAEYPGVLELREALDERARRDCAQCLAELPETRATVVGGVEDGDGVAALEEVRRTANVLGNGP